MLELADVHTYYGNIRALRGVSLTVAQGEIVTLIGSNGAGKTTTLKTILGTTRPRRGTVTFSGQRLDTLATGRIEALAAEGDRAAARPRRAENRLQRGRLAGAVAPDQGDDLALRDRERDAAERPNVAVVGVNVGQLKHAARARSRCPGRPRSPWDGAGSPPACPPRCARHSRAR